MSKKSIRFFNDREVRAVSDEEHSKWWFSATDIVRAINDEEDYKKCRNYWKYLKNLLSMHTENPPLVCKLLGSSLRKGALFYGISISWQ